MVVLRFVRQQLIPKYLCQSRLGDEQEGWQLIAEAEVEASKHHGNLKGSKYKLVYIWVLGKKMC
ncbi:MAG: hypothetical protein D6706_13990 [Chloroflexi bacterium]|nr:MAG: hypothetical protein D6706_13990 [Chloroflexota bacterium]